MKCIINGCDRVGSTRGLCHSCYLAAYTMVRKGKTTWEELAEKGLVNNTKVKPGPFRDAFKKAK